MDGKKILVYSTPVCPMCSALKNFLKVNNVNYEEKNVADDDAARMEMFIKTNFQRTVPVVDINGDVVVGFNAEIIRRKLELNDS